MRINLQKIDWRITPCSRRVYGFTPREAVAIIMSCEGMAADPADSTDCPTFARRRACSAAAAAQSARSSGSNREACTPPLLFICKQKEYCILVLQKQQKKRAYGAHPLAWLIASIHVTTRPLFPATTPPLQHLTRVLS